MEIFELDGNRALDTVVSELDSDERTLLCGPLELRDRLDFQIEERKVSLDEIVRKSEDVDVEAWFEDRCRKFESERGMSVENLLGEWVGEVKRPPLLYTLSPNPITGDVKKRVLAIRVHVDRNWKILAVLNFGGGNECPGPEIHCAIWRYWEAKYKAKILVIGCDLLEANVGCPPSSDEAAMALAMEQFLYCHDLVEQGCASISALGGNLMNSSIWYFWWD